MLLRQCNLAMFNASESANYRSGNLISFYHFLGISPRNLTLFTFFFARRCAWAENKTSSHLLRITACDKASKLISSPLFCVLKESRGGGGLCMRLHLVKKDIYVHDPVCFASRHATG